MLLSNCIVISFPNYHILFKPVQFLHCFLKKNVFFSVLTFVCENRYRQSVSSLSLTTLSLLVDWSLVYIQCSCISKCRVLKANVIFEATNKPRTINIKAIKLFVKNRKQLYFQTNYLNLVHC